MVLNNYKSHLVDLVLRNLATAGIIEQSEMGWVRWQLEPVSTDDLVAVLLSSYQMLEDLGMIETMPMVTIGQISLN